MAISVGEGGKTIPRPSGKDCYGEFMQVGVEGGNRGLRAVYLPDPEMKRNILMRAQRRGDRQGNNWEEEHSLPPGAVVLTRGCVIHVECQPPSCYARCWGNRHKCYSTAVPREIQRSLQIIVVEQSS